MSFFRIHIFLVDFLEKFKITLYSEWKGNTDRLDERKRSLKILKEKQEIENLFQKIQRTHYPNFREKYALNNPPIIDGRIETDWERFSNRSNDPGVPIPEILKHLK